MILYQRGKEDWEEVGPRRVKGRALRTQKCLAKAKDHLSICRKKQRRLLCMRERVRETGGGKERMP